MSRDPLRAAPSRWIKLGDDLLIAVRSDGAFDWEADSHPALAPAEVAARVRDRCEELQRAIDEVDAMLRTLHDGGGDGGEALDEYLDRRCVYTDRLRLLRDFLRHLDGPDAEH